MDTGNNTVTWLSEREGMVAMGLLTQVPVHSRAAHSPLTGHSEHMDF